MFRWLSYDKYCIKKLFYLNDDDDSKAIYEKKPDTVWFLI